MNKNELGFYTGIQFIYNWFYIDLCLLLLHYLLLVAHGLYLHQNDTYKLHMGKVFLYSLCLAVDSKIANNIFYIKYL